MPLRRIAGPAVALAILLLLGWWLGRGSAPATDSSTSVAQKAPRQAAPRADGVLTSPAAARAPILHVPSTPARSENPVVRDPAGATISGTVVDATGGVVPGGLVAELERDGPSATATQTDVSGKFVLSTRPGWVELTARADGYSQASQRVQAPAQGVTFVLAPGASIPGTVVDASSGSALADVRVVAAPESGLAAPGSASSDAAGEFQLSGLEGGVYLVSVHDDAFWSAPERVSVAVGQSSAPVVLHASRASRLRLTALYEAGAPCRDATALLSGDGAELHQFAADGRFEFEGLAPGDYDIEVQCAGALVQTERLQLGASVLDHEVVVSAGITLAGRVERASGERLVGAEVNVSPVGPPARAPASCTTDERGEFRCSGLSEGEHVARVMMGGEPASEAASVSLLPGDAPPLVLTTFGLGTIRVSLRDEGAEAADQRFDVVAISERGIPVEATEQAPDVLFENLPLGRYRLSIDSEPEDSDRGTEVTLARDGQVERVTLSPPATQSIAGRVLDEHRTPVVDASVRVSGAALGSSGSSAPNRQLAVTDEEGHFSLAGLPRGRYDLRVESSIGDGAARGIAAGTGSVDITVVRHARVSGSVRGPSGASPTTFLIAYEREDGSSHQVPGQAGRWDLGAIQPGKYRVTASSLSARASEEVLLRAGEARELVLQLSEP